MRRKPISITPLPTQVIIQIVTDGEIGYDAGGCITPWPGNAGKYGRGIAEAKIRKYKRAHPERTFILVEVGDENSST